MSGASALGKACPMSGASALGTQRHAFVIIDIEWQVLAKHDNLW